MTPSSSSPPPPVLPALSFQTESEAELGPDSVTAGPGSGTRPLSSVAFSPLNLSAYASTLGSRAASTRTSYTHVDLASMDNPELLANNRSDTQAQTTSVSPSPNMTEVGAGLTTGIVMSAPTTTTPTAVAAPNSPSSPATSPSPNESTPAPTSDTPLNPDSAPTPAPVATLAVEPIPQTPQVSLCFLLVSGRRRVMSFEPEMTVGRVKELVWNAWPGDWTDERPPAPSYLRILYLGKILQDEDTLRKIPFPIYPPCETSSPSPQTAPPPPTIVHLSIRPFGPDSLGNDDTMKKKKRKGSLGLGVGRRGTNMSTATTGAGSEGQPAQGGGGQGAGEGGGAGTEGGGAGCCGCIIC